jgi:radical SAM superfamily enzyme YgiQ (UPF0313 family)
MKYGRILRTLSMNTSKYNIYAMQLGNWGKVGSLPQSIGTIWSYAQTKQFVIDNFHLASVFWENQSVDEVIADIDTPPDIFMCSCYIWNWDRTYEIIKHVRQTYPKCLIVVGGPEPKYTLEWLHEHSEIDILVPYYGELAFVNILEEYLNKKDWNAVPGNITKDRHDAQYTYPSFVEIPSPYLNGFFDDLIAHARSTTEKFRCVFETNRGCPYQCTFCDIGALEYQKIRQFDLDRCYREIEWIMQQGMDSIDIADANFGILPRDEQIVDKIVELKQKYNWQGRIWPTWSKARGDRVMKLAKKLHDSGISTLFGLSLQSFNQDTLDYVKRTNAFNLEQMSDIVSEVNKWGLPAYTEIIFPLAGDTFDNFKQGLYKFIDMKRPFNKFQINHLSMLNNSEFADSQYEHKHKIKWKKVNGSTKMYNDESFTETICISTDRMTEQDVFEGQFFAKNFMIPLYYYGLVKVTCDTLQDMGIAKRSETLDQIYQIINKQNWFLEHKEHMRNHYFEAIKQGKQFGYKTKYGFYLQEFSVSHAVYKVHLIKTLLKYMPQYKELLLIDRDSQWYNTAQKTEYNTYKYLPGKWTFSDNREVKDKTYLEQLYIKGRFDDSWRTQNIERREHTSPWSKVRKYV